MSRFSPKAAWIAYCIAGVALVSVAHAADEWQAGADDKWRTVLAAAKKEGKVVVSGFPALAKPFTEEFKRDTGIELEYLGGSTSELSARLRREAKSNNLTIDISLGGGSELLTLYPEGLLEPVKPQMMLPGVTDPAKWHGGKTKWVDNESVYLFQGSNWVHAWPVMNSTLVPEGSVTSWKDLLKPEFKGKIVAFDPRSGGPGESAAAYLADTFGIEFLTQLYIGQGVTYTRDNRQLIEWLARGSNAIALGGVQISIEQFRTQGIKNLYVPEMKDGPGSVVGGFSVLKQAKGAPHPNAATVFINWYASKPGQEAYTRTMLETSTRTDVEVAQVPDYVKPKPGTKYLDQYAEDWYRTARTQVSEAIVKALGGR